MLLCINYALFLAPELKRLSLKACLKSLLDEEQDEHAAMSNTISCMRIAHEGAKRLGSPNYQTLLTKNSWMYKKVRI